MIFLKKYIRKLYHLIWFLGAFIIFISPVKAETIPFTLFRDTAAAYNPQCNDNLCVVYSVPWVTNQRYAFEWISTYSPSQSAPATLSGTFVIENPNITPDWLIDTVEDVYTIENGLSKQCTFSIPRSNTQIDFVCTYNSLPTNFTLGYHFRAITSSPSTINYNAIIIRAISISYDESTAAIIDNNNINTDRIINSDNNNTNNIINNNNQNTQDIINSSGSNTQSIIDNQNENSNKEIESQKVCKYIDKSSISLDNKYLSATGDILNATGVGITNFININSSTIEVLDSVTGSANSCFYNSNKELISCINLNNTSGTITIPNKSQYFRATISKSQNKPTFNICQNGNQALNDSVNGLNDTLNDSSVDSSDSTINNLKDKIPINSVISDLLLLPVRFLQNFVNALGSSCSAFSLGSLYGTELFMPCINIESYLGSGIWTSIDLIISGMFIYALRKKFIEIYENLTNLKNGGNEVD